MTKKTTACVLDCPDACSIVVETGKNGRDRLAGNPDHPFTKGIICPKGRGYPDRLRHPGRITRPLLKKSGRFEPIDWDEALALCAGKLNALRSDSRRILHVHGHAHRGVLARASVVLFRRLNASTTHGSVCDEAGIAANMEDYGSLQQNHPEELLKAARIVDWGRDLARNSIHTLALVRKARKQGARVLHVSPGGDDHAVWSDDFIQIRPGRDRFLAAAALRLLLDRGVAPEISGRVTDWAAFGRLIRSHTVRELSDLAGVNPGEAVKLASWYTSPGPTASIVGWGLQRYRRGGENVRFINALAMLSGQIGRPGGGTYYGISSSAAFRLWPVDPTPPPRSFLIQDLGRQVAAADPPVEFMYIDATNVVNQSPGSAYSVRALENCPFVVAADAFFNDTVLRADLVLPCALGLEKEDIIGSCFHPFVNHSTRIFDPPGEVRTDHAIIQELGRRLDPAVPVPEAEEMMNFALGSPHLRSNLTELRTNGFLKADFPAVAFENRFDHSDGKYHLPETLHLPEKENRDYPLTLLSLIRKKYIHSQIPEESQNGPLEVHISPASPALGSIDPDRPLCLVSPEGKLPVKLQWLDELHPEAVMVRRGGWMKHHHSVNPLVTPLETDLGGGTAYYSQKVRLENL